MSNPISTADFDFLRDILHRRSGLALSAEKRYLVESRLSILCRRLGISGIDEIVGGCAAGAMRRSPSRSSRR
jgi:chemotaxis protein methyltransferase CheR